MLWLLLITAVVAAFAIAGLVGAPYVPILRRDYQPLLDATGLQPGQTLIDLGSGDGRLLRAAAARGIRGIGYEINPVMVWISRLVCWRYRRLVTIRLANLWNTPLPPADTIYTFLLPKYMEQLDRYLDTHLVHPTQVISYVFAIPSRQPIKHVANAYFYWFESRPPV